MRFPFLLQRIKRRPLSCVIVLLVNLTAAGLIFALHIGSAAMETRIDDVYSTLRVTCSITNLTGTQSDDLNLPAWAVNLFFENPNYGVHVPETSFLDYVEDIEAKTVVQARFMGSPILIAGLTDIAAETMLRPENAAITWYNGYDESIFHSDMPVCLVPDGTYINEDGTITVSLSLMDGRDGGEDWLLPVVGTYIGITGNIYCPWNTAANKELERNGFLTATHIAATIRDNRKIDEFWEKCAGRYFATVDPKGEPQLWESSPMYTSYPFAFAIYDETLTSTVAELKRNVEIYRICEIAIILLSFGIGFVLGNLIVKRRKKEIALQYVLGLQKGNIFFEVLLEEAVFGALGILAVVCALPAVSGVAPPWGHLLAALMIFLLGVSGATYNVLRKDVFVAIKGAD